MKQIKKEFLTNTLGINTIQKFDWNQIPIISNRKDFIKNDHSSLKPYQQTTEIIFFRKPLEVLSQHNTSDIPTVDKK